MNMERAGEAARRAADGWADTVATAATVPPRMLTSSDAKAAPLEWPKRLTRSVSTGSFDRRVASMVS